MTFLALGLDPGTANSAAALVDLSGPRPYLLEYGWLDSPLCDMVEPEEVKAAALERPAFVAQPRETESNMANVGDARGVGKRTGKKWAEARPCARCEAQFRPLASDLRRGRGMFCSRSCATSSRASDVAPRFWPHVARGSETECWPWLGRRDGAGYGVVCLNGRNAFTHRVSLFLASGAMPRGVVMHACDNPPCVNPAHLSVGTQRENLADMRSKGRDNHVRGEACGRSVLTVEVVVASRAAHAGGASIRSLAKRAGVSYPTMRNVVLRKAWSHVP